MRNEFWRMFEEIQQLTRAPEWNVGVDPVAEARRRAERIEQLKRDLIAFGEKLHA